MTHPQDRAALAAEAYPDVDHMALGDYYMRHVDRMTVEKLHAKSDIAAQLAWRDREIDTLRAALAAAPAPAELQALENVRLYAARHRKEEWAATVLRFLSDAGVKGSPLRDAPKATEKDINRWQALIQERPAGPWEMGNGGSFDRTTIKPISDDMLEELAHWLSMGYTPWNGRSMPLSDRDRRFMYLLYYSVQGLVSRMRAAEKAALSAPAQQPADLACGHHHSLAINSAETGAFLYCDLCDAKSGRRDAEGMEAELQETVRQLSRALREEVESPTFMGEPVIAQQPAQPAEPMTLRFRRFPAEIPALVKEIDSLNGGRWQSEFCLAINNAGELHTALFVASSSEKRAIESGDKRHVSWRGRNSHNDYVAWAYAKDVSCIRVAAAQTALSPASTRSAAPVAQQVAAEPMPHTLQGGFDNHDLLDRFRKKLPGVTPTERELSSFAVGIEVGADHWGNVAHEYSAKARDYDRLKTLYTLAKVEIRRLGGDADAGEWSTPTAAGGMSAEPVRLSDAEIRTLNREAQDQALTGVEPAIYLARAIEAALTQRTEQKP